LNAFVFSGGGNLGSIQAGMLKALLEAGIEPEVVVGTSIGSVNAAVLAADPSLENVERICEGWIRTRSRDFLPRNPVAVARALLRQGAIFPSTSWRRYLESLIPYERIEEAAIPLRITVTDYQDGAPVTLESGPVVDAVLASTALPTVFPPHRIGEHLYLDGALAEQLPLAPAIEAGADTIYVLAVTVPDAPDDLSSAGKILRHSLTILLFPRIRLDALDLPTRHPDIQIVQLPSVAAQVALWDMSQTGELIEKAYEETKRFLAEREDDDSDEPEPHVATVPEVKVEVEQEDNGGDPATSSAARGRRKRG
jgi:NTE family protein